MIQFWHSEIDIQAVHNEFIVAHYLEASVSDHRLEEEKRVHMYKSLKYATRLAHFLFFLNPLRTTARLVKTNEVSILKPIRNIVRMVVELLRNESKYLETLILISCQHTNVM